MFSVASVVSILGAPDKVTIHFMGDKTLELEGHAAGEFIQKYELVVEGREPDEEVQSRRERLSRRR